MVILIGSIGAFVFALVAILIVERVVRRSVNVATLPAGWKPVPGTIVGREGRRS